MGHIVLHCIQLALGGLTARLQPALMGQEGNQGVSLHLLVVPCCAAPAEPQHLLRKRSPEQHWHSTKANENRWSLSQTVISNTPQNKPTTYFIFICRGDKNFKKQQRERLTSDVTCITVNPPLPCPPLTFPLLLSLSAHNLRRAGAVSHWVFMQIWAQWGLGPPWVLLMLLQYSWGGGFRQRWLQASTCKRLKVPWRSGGRWHILRPWEH